VSEETDPHLDGPIARGVGRVLHAIGYVLAYGLFLGARDPATVASRLRLAYRLVGVDIQSTSSHDGERTEFRCPYRTLGAGRYGERRVCHDVLDRVDDGYVTYLARRGIDYERPQACEAGACCYSVVDEAASD
jgi:hypothetical protein